MTPIEQLLKDPDTCPHCKSTEISASEYDGGGHTLTCEVTCDNCGTSWVEEYYLKNISQYEPSEAD